MISLIQYTLPESKCHVLHVVRGIVYSSILGFATDCTVHTHAAVLRSTQPSAVRETELICTLDGLLYMLPRQLAAGGILFWAVRACVHAWSGVLVACWCRSTKLTYAGPY